MITIPTIKELYDAEISALETELEINIPLIGKNFLRVFAGVQSLKLKLLYLALGEVQKNIHPDTAYSEDRGGTLERMGRIYLGRNPNSAIAGVYTIQATGTIGSTIEAETVFKSSDSSTSPGMLYITDIPYTLTGSSINISVRALEAGVESKLTVTDQLALTRPVSGVDKKAFVTSETTEPKAAETLEDYRQAIINSRQQEPRGGAGTDFRLWASDAQGVREIYPFAREGYDSEINIYVEATEDDSTDGKGTPSATLLAEVESVINFDPDTSKELKDRGRRPATDKVNCIAVSIKEIDINVDSFTSVTAEEKTLIETSLKEALSNTRPYVSSAEPLSYKNDILDTNKIIGAILSAKPGAIFGTVTLQVDSVSLSSYTFENGNIPHLNSVTYS